MLAHDELQGLCSAGRRNVREPAEYTETIRPSMRTVHPAVETRSSHVTTQPLRMGWPETVWVRETGWADRWAAARADRTTWARITGCTEEVQVPPRSSSSSPDNRAGPHDPKPQAAACSVLCEPTQELLLLLASVALVPQPAVGSLSRVQANTPTLRWANQESSLLYRARLPQVSLYPGEAPCIQVCCALLSGLVCSPSCAAFHEACAHKPLLSKC